MRRLVLEQSCNPVGEHRHAGVYFSDGCPHITRVIIDPLDPPAHAVAKVKEHFGSLPGSEWIDNIIRDFLKAVSE